jgi:mRNA interferase RelE/StbE
VTLAGNPRSGDQLHGDFEGLFKLRVGDYRVIYALVGQDVLVLRIRHRSKAYA